MKPVRVAIAGGGTGGHLIPALAVARVLRQRGVERIVFIGTARGLETRLAPQAGFELALIQVGGLKNTGMARRLGTLARLPGAVAASARILRAMDANVAFGIGGYASGPALLAAWLLGIPVALLEVNQRTGLANRLASRWARVAAVNFPETAADFRKAVVTGIPVRDAFFSLPRPAGDPPGLLIFGGSQGARALNETLPEAAKRWQESGLRLRILHQTGAAGYEPVKNAYVAAGVDAEVEAFIDDMPAAMAMASLLICRSGASTLGELAAAGRPALLVPLPNAADQHQLHNAEAFAEAGAAIVMPQPELTAEALASQVEELLKAPARLAAMAEAARARAHPGAAEAIAQLVLQAAE